MHSQYACEVLRFFAYFFRPLLRIPCLFFFFFFVEVGLFSTFADACSTCYNASCLLVLRLKEEAAHMLESFGWGEEFIRINKVALDMYVN